VSEILVSQGQQELAAQVRRFAEELAPARTEKDRIAADLMESRGTPGCADNMDFQSIETGK
jgi:hypothetical protein